MLAIHADAFEAIHAQAVEAYDHRRILRAKVTLIGDALPGTETPPVSPLDLCLKPKNLDVSRVQDYGVRDFEISATRYFDHRRSRVSQVKRGPKEAYGATISVLLTEARYDVDVEHARFHAISCQGHVIGARGKSYDGVDVEIVFDQFDRNRHYELPKMAYFGEFIYLLKASDQAYSLTHLAFHLRYLPEDARDFIIPLLSRGTENEVILTVNLTSEEEELLAATDKLSGKVRHYSFRVRSRLQALKHDQT